MNGALRFALPAAVRQQAQSSRRSCWGCGRSSSAWAGRADVPFEVLVEVVELLGNEMLIYGRLGEDRLVIRAESAAAIATDDRVPVAFDPAAVHYFDGATDAALG